MRLPAAALLALFLLAPAQAQSPPNAPQILVRPPGPSAITLVVEPGQPGAAPVLRLPGLTASGPSPRAGSAPPVSAAAGLALAAALGAAGFVGVYRRGGWRLALPLCALAAVAVVGASGCPGGNLARNPLAATRPPRPVTLTESGTLSGEVLLEPGRLGQAWLVLDRDALEKLAAAPGEAKP